MYLKSAGSSECFAVPVGTSESKGDKLKTFLQEYDGEEL